MEAVAALLHARVDASAMTRAKSTAFHNAAVRGNPAVLHLMLEHHAHLEQPSGFGIDCARLGSGDGPGGSLWVRGAWSASTCVVRARGVEIGWAICSPCGLTSAVSAALEGGRAPRRPLRGAGSLCAPVQAPVA